MHSYVALLLHWIFIEERDLEKLVKTLGGESPYSLLRRRAAGRARTPAAAANGCLQAPGAKRHRVGCT